MAQGARRTTDRIAVLAAAVLATLTAVTPATAQEPPLLSLPDVMRQIGLMQACNRSWNLHIDEAQTNTDPGDNLDLSPLRGNLHLLQQAGSASSVIAMGTEVPSWTQACGALIVASNDPNDHRATTVLYQALEQIECDMVMDIVREKYDVESAGRSSSSNMPTRMQKAVDLCAADALPKLRSQLAQQLVNAADLRIIAHRPAVLSAKPENSKGQSDEFEKVPGRVASDLRTLFPSL